MKVLDLFSGIGGFSLGLERAGMETVAFCEFDKKAQLVLKKHWPDVPIYDDVRELTYDKLKEDGIVVPLSTSDGLHPQDKRQTTAGEDALQVGRHSAPNGRVGGNNGRKQASTVDLICGGFPCQPFSQAGKRKGEEDDRHLWPEYFRLIQEIRPRWVIGENVAGLISMGLDQVLSDLESEDYSCQTLIIPACALNAPHRRDRVWIIAHAEGVGDRREGGDMGEEDGEEDGEGGAITIGQPIHGSEDVADSESERRECGETGKSGIDPQCEKTVSGRGGSRGNTDFWATEPDVGRVAHGIPNRVDRLKQLGNAVVPQVVEQIGRAIMEIENAGND